MAERKLSSGERKEVLEARWPEELFKNIKRRTEEVTERDTVARVLMFASGSVPAGLEGVDATLSMLLREAPDKVEYG